MKCNAAELFVLGAAGYPALELLWRGRTHWTMALTGGAVLVGLASLRKKTATAPFLSRCMAGGALITLTEYLVGLTVNRHYHMNVWDYSSEKWNAQGQICAKYGVLWIALSALVMLPKQRENSLYIPDQITYNRGTISQRRKME